MTPMLVVALLYVAIASVFLVDDLRCIKRTGWNCKAHEPVICALLWPWLIAIIAQETWKGRR